MGKVLQSDLNSQFLVQIISTQNSIRSKNLAPRLTELGLDFKISPGVVPKENDFRSGVLHSAFLSKLLCQRTISIGEVGCALAHRNALINFLNSHQEFGIVFEDDAEVVSDFDFDKAVKLLDSNTPIVLVLGWIPGFAIAKHPQADSNESLVELITSPTCAFAYAINRPAAKLIVNNQKKIIDLADWPIYVLNKVSFYSASAHSPWVTANHDPNLSVIGVRTISWSKRPSRVLFSRIRLATSLVTLFLLCTTKILDVSPKQIVHRVLIRDMLYKYGKSQINEKSNENNVAFLPLNSKLRRLLDFLKLS